MVIISPSTARIDRGRKLGVYARETVSYLWFVDPLARTLEVFRLDAGRWVIMDVHEGTKVVRAEPFGAVELDTARWWPD